MKIHEERAGKTGPFQQNADGIFDLFLESDNGIRYNTNTAMITGDKHEDRACRYVRE